MSHISSVLIVDDDTKMCDSLKALLVDKEYNILTTHSGKEALRYLEKDDFDLAVLDIFLPDLDGHQILNYMNTQCPNTVAIVMTGYASVESAISSLRKGAYDYLKKPFEPEEFVRTVENALNKKMLERENKLIYEKLTQAEKRYRYLVDNSPDIIYTLDTAGNFSFINNTIEYLLGFRSDELIGRHYSAVVYDKDIDKARYHFNERRTGERATVTTQLRLKFHHNGDGDKKGSKNYLPVELKAMGIYGHPDRIAQSFIGTYGVARDVSFRMEAEEALRQSEAKYRELVQNANSIILRRDPQGNITFFNEYAQKFFGYTEEEILGKNEIGMIVPEKDSNGQDLTAMIRDIGIHPERYATNENENMRCNGERVWVAWTNKAIHDEQGNIVEILCIGNDITERKRLEAQLQQAQKMEAIGTLAGGLAHDFNNLLMGIQGYASLTLMDLDSGHPHSKRLKGIERLVQSGADLTKQLLGFARGGKYEVQTTNLNRLIQKSAEMFGRTKKEITIHTKYQEDIWPVEIDQGQIQQVMLNLYVNAWHAMPGGGDLYIETEHVSLTEIDTKPYQLDPGNYVKISVTDTGVGMDESTQQRIFDPFFTTKEMGRGTGLGLATVYGIIKNHEGFITVHSVKGKGSEFTVYLPASEKKVENEKMPAEEIVRGRETVLLVDDEKVILEVGEGILNALGYKVVKARGGKEAIEIYSQNRDTIDMVILDMIMPDMGGGDTYRKLKEMDPNIKVLLSSGYSVNGQATEILKKGCNGFIQKPFSAKNLSKKLREILDNDDAE
jgi:two-component system cell cycle sensor histidine kinase/response regulator CckA